MPKQYIDLPDMQEYHTNIKDYIDTKTNNTIRETTSSSAPQSAKTGDYWTELITDNNNN